MKYARWDSKLQKYVTVYDYWDEVEEQRKFQKDRDEYIREMSAGGPRYEPGNE